MCAGYDNKLHGRCSYCATEDPTRLGICWVCDQAVCDKCGNVQYVKGERKVVHRACLNNSDDGFSMIKFVK